MSIDTLFTKLDIDNHVKHLQSFFSRDCSIILQGDQQLHFRYIEALDKLEFNAPPHTQDFHTPLMHLKKSGVLGFESIFEILKVTRYFNYLNNQEFKGLIGEYLKKIVIPDEIKDIDSYFDTKGSFKEDRDEELLSLSSNIANEKNEISAKLKRLIYNSKLSSYLVDNQVHYINDQESLLVRGGFNSVLKGSIVSRSTQGFFFVSPDVIMKSKDKIRALNQEKDRISFEYAKSFSIKLKEIELFLKFIDKEFTKFDHYQARVLFARATSTQIIKSLPNQDISLYGFKHPSIDNAKSVDVDFNGNVLMITGVNAGGKTMLLKSILSSSIMAKYIIPFHCDKTKTKIGTFKKINAIIDDPQNVKNDISTFAGRMLAFSEQFSEKNALIGVDEIELGTDSDEAAALFKVILDELIKRGQKVIVTTHHKRLASLMADRDDVSLMAAIYDEERRKPTYEFLSGIIGKSYAFETALRYKIPPHIVSEAKEVYGEQHERLNLLIERGSTLERELKQKNKELDKRLQSVKSLETDLKDKAINMDDTLLKDRRILEKEYSIAIKSAKEAASMNSTKEIHKKLNEANKNLPKKYEKEIKQNNNYEFKVGQRVKYLSQQAQIVSIKGNEAFIETELMKLRVKLRDLKPSGNVKNVKPKVSVTTQKDFKSGLKLDLHGLRAEEANEKLDKFLNDALMQGFDEVLVYHGIGTGKLSYSVKEFLKTHPSVKGFKDAPISMGGYGAKLIEL